MQIRQLTAISQTLREEIARQQEEMFKKITKTARIHKSAELSENFKNYKL